MIACDHCRLPVPGDRVRDGEDQQFCCSGCHAAYRLIHEHGLEAYYDLSEDDDPTRVGEARVSYAAYDDPPFFAQHVARRPLGRCSITFAVEGIHCAACIWLLERLPQVIDGVIEARVHWRAATVEVLWDPTRVRLSTIAQTMASLGYRPRPKVAGQGRDRVRENRRQLVRIGIAAAAAGNNMLLAAALYLGMGSAMDGSIETLLRAASCVVAVAALLGPGRVFLRGAWGALRSRTPHMDLPVALGLCAGTIAGVVNTIRGTGEIYFDTLSVLVFLLLVGRYIQSRQQQHAADAVEVLYRLTPNTAHKVEGTVVVDIPAEVIAAGDVLQIEPGEVVPADGTVIGGASAVDENVLTGESSPVAADVGSTIAAGTVNLSAPLRIRIDAVGTDTRMGRILAMVERTAGERPAVVALADRIGAVFVLTVIAIAAVTVGAWLTIDPGAAIGHGVAVLIVACPCALALATPLAVSVALGRAARHEILIKGADVLQRLAAPGTIWLDKTGTLTEGATTVVHWSGDDSLRPAIAAIERTSAHPVAHALTVGFEDAGLVAEAVQHRTGGVEGIVEGKAFAIGNEAFVRGHVAQLEDRWTDAATAMVEAGTSPVFVAAAGRTVAVAGIGDPIRSDARDTITHLQTRGWRVGILSGDHAAIVSAVGRQLGISESRCHGGLTPEDKVQYVRGTPGPGTTVMVGDGINDSAALAAAAVGIATRNGAEASLQAAPVYLGRPGLQPIEDLLLGSRRTMRTIRRNFAVSIAYNAAAVTLAAVGWMGPLVAAVLMPISSLSVVGLSLALRWPSRGPR